MKISWRDHLQYLDLLAILASAFFLRLSYFTGMVRGDAFNYANAAFELSQGNFDLNAWDGSYRIGLYLPVAGLYKIFGANEISTLAIPFLCSLISIILIYAIASIFAGRTARFVAASLWAFMPLDIHLSSTLLADVPVTALGLLSIYFSLKIEGSDKRRRIIFVLACAAFLLWAILVKPTAIVLLVFYAIRLIWWFVEDHHEMIAQKMIRFGLTPGKLFGIFVACLTITVFYYGSLQSRPLVISLARTASNVANFMIAGATELDFSDVRFSKSYLFVYIAPLFVLSFIDLLASPNQRKRILIIWLSAFFLYFEWGTFNFNFLNYTPYDNHIEARSLLLLLPPLYVSVGIFFEKLFGNAVHTRLLTITAFFGSTAYALAISETIMNGETPHIVLSAAGLSVAGVLLIYMFRDFSIQIGKAVAVATVFAATLIAGLRPSLPYHALMYADRLEELQGFREAAEIILQDSNAYVLVKNNGRAIRLNYASNFALGYDWSQSGWVANPRIQIGCDLPAAEGDFYVLGDHCSNEISLELVELKDESFADVNLFVVSSVEEEK